MGVKEHLLGRISEVGTIHMTLLDPDKVSAREFRELALMVQEYGMP